MTVTRLPRPLRGVIPPMVTPLRNRDELDADGLARLVNHIVDAGVAGLFLLGTTGEGPSLSYRLRYELVERTCELVDGRVPVLVGITDTSLVEALELANFSADVGASAVVAAAPYYLPVGQAELLTFFSRLAEESPLPVFLYNMPSCVKLSLAPETVRALAAHPNVIGVKDSSGDMAYFRELLSLRTLRPDWTILMGPEHLLAESVLAGSDGGVTGGANLHPRLFVEQYAATLRQDRPEIARLQSLIERLGKIYQVGGTGAPAYLAGLKSALSAAELCSPVVAEPLNPLNPTEVSQIESLVEELGVTTTMSSSV